jgi:outer membrane lipoprotein-sorting protein
MLNKKNMLLTATAVGLAAMGHGAAAAAAPEATAAAAPAAAAAAAPAAAGPTPAGPARAAVEPAAPAHLSAAQIVEKNVAARGGLAAWHSVRTMIWKGRMGAGAATYEVVSRGKLDTRQRDEAQLPFTLEFKRPLKTRLEIQFNGQTAVQVFDGANGWKLRPYLGRASWDAYTPDEVKLSATEPGVDGFLIDYAAKGAKVDLVGTEKVEDHAAYKLKVTLKGGQVRHVWVDARTFLEAKVEGLPRRLDGKPHDVEVFLRDFKPEGGVVIPHVIETHVQGLRRAEKITIENATVNPKLDDSRFTKHT